MTHAYIPQNYVTEKIDRDHTHGVGILLIVSYLVLPLTMVVAAPTASCFGLLLLRLIALLFCFLWHMGRMGVSGKDSGKGSMEDGRRGCRVCVWCVRAMGD